MTASKVIGDMPILLVFHWLNIVGTEWDWLASLIPPEQGRVRCWTCRQMKLWSLFFLTTLREVGRKFGEEAATGKSTLHHPCKIVICQYDDIPSRMHICPLQYFSNALVVSLQLFPEYFLNSWTPKQGLSSVLCTPQKASAFLLCAGEGRFKDPAAVKPELYHDQTYTKRIQHHDANWLITAKKKRCSW